jgi:hypothetical protein
MEVRQAAHPTSQRPKQYSAATRVIQQTTFFRPSSESRPSTISNCYITRWILVYEATGGRHQNVSFDVKSNQSYVQRRLVYSVGVNSPEQKYAAVFSKAGRYLRLGSFRSNPDSRTRTEALMAWPHVSAV